MKIPLLGVFLCAVCLFAFGCANATRTHLDPDEGHYEFTIRHQMGMHPAYLKVEQTLAELDLTRTLSQSETGYMLLRPQVAYRVGGPLGDVVLADYVLRIEIQGSAIQLNFLLGKGETSDGWLVYPPKTEMPKIQGQFQFIAASIARSVNGSLDNASPDPPKAGRAG